MGTAVILHLQQGGMPHQLRNSFIYLHIVMTPSRVEMLNQSPVGEVPCCSASANDAGSPVRDILLPASATS